VHRHRHRVARDLVNLSIDVPLDLLTALVMAGALSETDAADRAKAAKAVGKLLVLPELVDFVREHANALADR
jgi:hypothetical protein